MTTIGLQVPPFWCRVAMTILGEIILLCVATAISSWRKNRAK